MQSTEATTQKRPDLDALIQEVITSTFRDRYTAKEAKSLAMELAAALAAERDRADRAEAALAEVSATVDKFAGRKYDAEVQKHGDPEYWRGAEHAQDYIVQRVRTALGKKSNA